MSIEDFSAMVTAQNGRNLDTMNQSWVMENGGRARIFAFTDLDGQRAMFVDVTEF